MPQLSRLTVADAAGNARHAIGVHLILTDPQGRILLGLRSAGVALAANTWSTMCGNLEADEPMPHGAAREAAEELGIAVDPTDLEFKHLIHFVNHDDGAGPAAAVFFAAKRWNGQPQIMEPDKCDRLEWFDPAALPQPFVGYGRHALACIQLGVSFSTQGWDRP